MGLERTILFSIETELTPAHFDGLLRFIHQRYILVHAERFANIELRMADHDRFLSFRALGPHEKDYVDVEIKAGKQIQVRMTPNNEKFPKDELDRIKEDLTIGVNTFEEQVRRTTIYFVWVEGEKIIPEKPPASQRNIIRYMFSDSMFPLFIIFAAISIYLFTVLGPYAPVVLVAIQFPLVLLSGRIIARMADWQITSEESKVHIFEYQLPIEGQEDFKKKFNRDTLIQIKTEIYEKTLGLGKAVDCETVNEILSRHGLKGSLESMSTKTVNVYGIVKNAADKFGLPVPRIVIENLTLPNAAASGPSPSQGVMLITTGLLVRLDDNELLSVVGHELSHLRGRDTLVFFGLTSLEFLLRIYVIWPLVLYLGVFYFVVAFGLVYFVAKFFEGKSDLEAAKVLGQPKVLAEALSKIGFQRLQLERMPTYRIFEWIGWDPHPPIYFRIDQLEKLEAPEKLEHPLLQSIKNNIRGFLAALG